LLNELSVGGEGAVAETVNSIICTDPHYTVPVGGKTENVIAVQSVFPGKILK
jgi:hypothetical protein